MSEEMEMMDACLDNYKMESENRYKFSSIILYSVCYELVNSKF
jgi:hypothetical protein